MANGGRLFKKCDFGYMEFLVIFYPINTTYVVFSPDTNMSPLNSYPNYDWMDRTKTFGFGGVFSSGRTKGHSLTYLINRSKRCL